MRVLAAALLALLPVAAGAVSVPAQPQIKAPPMTKGVISLYSGNCQRTTTYHAYNPGEPLQPRRLAELPPANAYATVLHHDGRCEIPVVIRYGVGLNR